MSLIVIPLILSITAHTADVATYYMAKSANLRTVNPSQMSRKVSARELAILLPGKVFLEPTVPIFKRWIFYPGGRAVYESGGGVGALNSHSAKYSIKHDGTVCLMFDRKIGLANNSRCLTLIKADSGRFFFIKDRGNDQPVSYLSISHIDAKFQSRGDR